MLRNLILIAVCVLLNAQLIRADERPDKAWTKYLEGRWTYEISDGTKGSAEWTYEADGQSMIGRFKEGDSTGLEIGGWQPDSAIVMVNGYDSKGNYWQLEYKHFSETGGRGPIRGKTEDVEYSGDFQTTIQDEDNWGWTIKGKTFNGEEMKLSATFKRVKPSAISAEEAKEWLNFFVGSWKRERELWIGDEKAVDTATWNCELAADGNAAISKGKWDQDGSTWVAISGLDPHKIQFERGMTSTGLNWAVDFNELDGKALHGTLSGVVDGKHANGPITLTKTGDDSYTAAWEVKLADGEVRRAKVTNKRVE